MLPPKRNTSSAPPAPPAPTNSRAQPSGRNPQSIRDMASGEFRRSGLQTPTSHPLARSAEGAGAPTVNREVAGSLGSVLGKDLVRPDASLDPDAIRTLNSMLTTRGVREIALDVNKVLVVDGNPPLDTVRFKQRHTELTRKLMSNPRYLKYAAVTAFILLSLFGLSDDVARQVGESAGVVTKEVAGAVGDALKEAGDVAGDGALAFLKGLGIDPYMISGICACISILMVVAFAMSMFA